MSEATLWTALSGHTEEETQVPQELWWHTYLWLDNLPIDEQTDKERSFANDKYMLFVQLYEGQLRYVFGEKPRSWNYIEQLI